LAWQRFLDKNTVRLDKTTASANTATAQRKAANPWKKAPSSPRASSRSSISCKARSKRTGAPPTRAEIAAELGFRSPNAAEEHLQALARKGVIELIGGTSRGIRLKSDTLRALNAARLSQYGKQFSLPFAQPGAADASAGGSRRCRQPDPRAGTHRSELRRRSVALPAQPDYLLKVRGMSMRDAASWMATCSRCKRQGGEERPDRRRAPGDDVTVKRLRPHALGHRAAARETPISSPSSCPPYDASFELEGIAVDSFATRC